jgi:UTP--glucose-1-phosphate uridylyltransferase
MRVRKAVVSAAHPDHATLPGQVFVDRDGRERTAFEIQLSEVVDAGIEHVAVVVPPGAEPGFADAAGKLRAHVTFLVQDEPTGYSDSVRLSAAFVGDEPFLHLVSDHLYLADGAKQCARQLLDVAEREACAVSAVQATRESLLHLYGTIGGLREPGPEALYRIRRVLEKPTPTEAEQELQVSGLRHGHYLCLFGMHVFTPALQRLLAAAEDSSAPLAESLEALAGQERYLACEIRGQRYNMGVRYGRWWAQLALALGGDDRERILSKLAEWLATRQLGALESRNEADDAGF